MTTCTFCSTELSDAAKFCSECGKATPVASTIESTFNAAVDFVGSVAEETGKQVSGVLQNQNAQKVAGGAAVGAVAAVFLPFVTMGAGALIGAGVAAYKLAKKPEA